MPKKVLLVDDSEIVLEVIRMNLEEEGFEVSTLENAVQLHAVADDIQPDVILLDIRMPGLRGDEAARLLQHLPGTRKIPVILHSEVSEDELAHLCEDLGAAGYIRKTPDGADLAKAILAHLDGRKQAAITEGSGSRPALSEQFLDGMRKMQERTGRDMLGRMAELFEETQPRLTSLGTATQAHDSEQSTELAHFLKGTARAIGALDLHDLCQSVEEKCRTQEWADILDLLPKLTKEHERVRQAFAAELAAG